MKRIFVLAAICAVVVGAFAVESSWRKPWCEKIDLADITSVPIGMRLRDDGGYGLPTNGNEVVLCSVPPEWSEGAERQCAYAKAAVVACACALAF